jgi:hypothetical protein
VPNTLAATGIRHLAIRPDSGMIHTNELAPGRSQVRFSVSLATIFQLMRTGFSSGINGEAARWLIADCAYRCVKDCAQFELNGLHRTMRAEPRLSAA